MTRYVTGAFLIAATLGICLLTAPVTADWLVMQDGTSVETRGPWQVKGKMIVFTMPNGTLSSLRADTVDLEASQAATKAASAPPAEEVKEPESREPVRVITDDDVGHVNPYELAAEEDEESTDEEASTTSSSSSEELEVSSWTETFDAEVGGTIIAGSVRNNGSSIAMQVVVTVSLLDEDGGLIARNQADLVQPSVPPNRAVSFRAEFQGVSDFDEVSFDISSRQLRLIPATAGG